MIKKIDIDSMGLSVSPKQQDYIRQKIGKLDTYVPRNSREGIYVDVKIKQAKTKKRNDFTCEVIMKLAREKITVSEQTSTLEAAVDAAQDKMKARLKKYKAKHTSERLHKKVLAKLRRQTG